MLVSSTACRFWQPIGAPAFRHALQEVADLVERSRPHPGRERGIRTLDLLALDGEEVVGGKVLLAPAGRHMKLRKRGARIKVWLDDEPRQALHKPSADVLMARTTSSATWTMSIVTGTGGRGLARSSVRLRFEWLYSLK